ncbi:hypothetical protein SMICM17S_09132 [Streptomyces microflavus]
MAAITSSSTIASTEASTPSVAAYAAQAPSPSGGTATTLPRRSATTPWKRAMRGRSGVRRVTDRSGSSGWGTRWRLPSLPCRRSVSASIEPVVAKGWPSAAAISRWV